MNSSTLLDAGTDELEILEFTLAGESFGINVAKVRELMQYSPVRALPNAHPCVEGVFQPRDEVYAVLNLAPYLGLPDSGDPQKHIYIITSFNNMKVAFHVHSVESIHRLSWSDLEKPDNIVYGGKDGVVTGIVRLDGKISAILDFEKIAFDISPETGFNMSDIEQRGKRMDADKPILIVEDSVLLRKMLLESLHKAGYGNILSVANGEEAWDMLSRLGVEKDDVLDSVSLVITDIEMPRMAGIQLTKRIKEDVKLKKIPVVVFTSIMDEQTRLKCEQAGADAQLSKPEIGSLISVIDGFILN
ncbi:MAG: chemotaxis protein [Oscillospiraceae bacterium]|jgi:two-component system chemotaxis response regulator CheV